MALPVPWQSPVPVSDASPAVRPNHAARPGAPPRLPAPPPGREPWEDEPGWWPYASEFPHWHVWRGVAGLLYARRPRSSPPKVVRAKDEMTLRERIISAETVA